MGYRSKITVGGLVSMVLGSVAVNPVGGIVCGLLTAGLVAVTNRGDRHAEADGVSSPTHDAEVERRGGADRTHGPAAQSPNGFQRWLLSRATPNVKAATTGALSACILMPWLSFRFGLWPEAILAGLGFFALLAVVLRLHMQLRPLAWEEHSQFVRYWPTIRRRTR